MKGFWKNLKKPFFVLAPMADVTDAAFRQIIAKYGKPDVFWTEFVSADGLCSPIGREKLLIDLAYTEEERPIVAQIFSSNPDNIRETAKLIKELGFDGLDINMGCPDRTIEKQGAGASLMKNPKLAQEIILAAKEGAGDMPVSVKTRLGYNKDILEEWLPALLEARPAVITVHARNRKELSDFPARWEMVKRAVEIRDELKSETLIIGNGDVKDIKDAEMKVKETGADGVMLGRSIFGNPFLFNRKQKEVDIKTRLEIMVEHTKLFEELFNGKKNFAVMKKHYKAYAHGFIGAKELRVELMETKNAKEVEGIVEKFLGGSL
ncbi:MAG: tRNA-dihydrouridine synthase [Parcubacteria group bacterium LiPW_30]|nr:MAG: tRNA-dihydrouridine synthase [Parcubacteria group bacterium LiPW_30]